MLKPHPRPAADRKPPVKRQFVAGFVIYRRTNEGIKYLLLYRRGQYWNFPKGHFYPGERTIDVALRELEEETGIRRSDLHIIPNFRAYERFYFRIGNQGIYDRVALFLAESKSAVVRISPREHAGFAWFTYHDAMRTIGKKYEGVKRVIKQANDFLVRRDRRHA